MTFRQPWWERHRRVLEEEEAGLRDLADDGRIEPDVEALRAEVRRYTLTHTCDGMELSKTVTFSDLHPYFPPYVTADQQTDVHQNPYNGQLCLLEGDTWHWDPSQTVAAMIGEQLPELLADRPAENPDDDAPPPDAGHVEPYAGYFPCGQGTAVHIGDTTADLSGVDSGTMTLVLDRPGAPEMLRGTVTEIRSAEGDVRWTAAQAVVERHAHGSRPRLEVPWVRLPHPPDDSTAHAVFDAAETAERPAVPRAQAVGAGAEVAVAAVVFEDGIRPFERGDAWLFAVRGSKEAPPQTGRARPPRPTVDPYLARPFRSDRQSMTERVPSLATLADKKVVVFGAGGVGAPLAIEFAKAGTGTVVVVDRDFIDPGTAVRWPLGYQYAGHDKVLALADFIQWQWPHTTVVARHDHVGRPRTLGGEDPHWEAMHLLLADADLVADATAEVGVTHYLSDLTREMELPLLIVSTTEGGWGGRVVHLGSGDDAPCWYCIEAHTRDGTLATPPGDPDPARGNVHPAGCVTTTFTATGFDVATMSLAAMRLAASLLASGTDNGYPPAEWNAAIYTFRDDSHALPGSAESFTVTRHPACESCNNRSSG